MFCVDRKQTTAITMGMVLAIALKLKSMSNPAITVVNRCIQFPGREISSKRTISKARGGMYYINRKRLQPVFKRSIKLYGVEVLGVTLSVPYCTVPAQYSRGGGGRDRQW